MANETYLADLERKWLAAESAADELKHEAKRSSSVDMEERVAAADKTASDAFDRLWTARGAAPETGATPTGGLGADANALPTAVMSAK